ncbi:MAG TPA: FtsX-like permease family protein [Candidatus Dormibacteraeota bacterium]|nr:FtsX-like permease family protein [Candidatus Dormibacteraeota bacterium]
MIPLLWRRAALARLALGVAALALGGGAVLGTQLTAGALHRQASAAIQQRAGSAEYDIQPFARAGFTIPQVQAIAKLQVVTAAAPLEEKADLARLPSHAFRQVVLVATGPRGVALRPLPVIKGSRPQAQNQVAVSQNLAPGISLSTGAVTPGRVGIGQTLQLIESKADRKFKVVGVVANSSLGAPFTADAVYITPAAAQKLFSAGLQVTEVAVRLRSGATVSQLLKELSHSVHTQYTVSNPRSVPQGDPVGELQPILDGITALSLVLAFAVIAATFSSLVLDRRREIGLLRLGGASRGLIFRSFLREAVAASALGAALGVGVGYLLALILVAVSTPAGVSPAPQLQADVGWTVTAFLLVLLLGLAAATLPAVQAARIPPLLAVRPPAFRQGRGWRLQLPLLVLGVLGAYFFFANRGALGVGLGAAFAYLAICAVLGWVGPFLVRALSMVVGPLMATPVAAISARGRTRPARTSLALAALFVSVATAIGLVGLSGAALTAGQVWVDHLFVGQYLLVSPVVQSQQVEKQVLSAISAKTGTTTVVASAPVRFVTGRVGHEAVSLAATSATAYGISGALQFVHGDRATALAEVTAGQGVLLPLELSSTLHAGVGATMKVITTTGTGSFRVVGVVAHTLPGPSGEESVLVDSAVAKKDFGTAAEGFNLIQLQLRGEGNLQHPVALAGFRYGLEEETVSTVRQGVDLGVEHDIAVLSALALVGVVIAILAAVNTVVLGAREGTRDMALLRVVGLSRAETRRAVLGEALATAVTGCALGIAVGIALIAPEVQAANSAALPLSFEIPGLVVLAVVGSVVAAILVAAVIPARQLSDLDPVAALNVE